MIFNHHATYMYMSNYALITLKPPTFPDKDCDNHYIFAELGIPIFTWVKLE